jgi:hypothetical protein
MLSLRSCTLALAPLLIVAASYRLTMWNDRATQGAVLLSDVQPVSTALAPAASPGDMRAACEQVAADLRKR